jgi:DNA ligase-4
LQKGAKENIIRPVWIFDCVKQNEADAGLPTLLLPLEPRYVHPYLEIAVTESENFCRHMFFIKDDQQDEIEDNVDKFNDSYARDTTVEELKEVSCSLQVLLIQLTIGTQASR